MTAIRLERGLERAVENIARVMGLTKSALIRKCLETFVTSYGEKNAWELGRDLFGKHGSGQRHLAANAEQILRAKIKAGRG